MVLFSKSILPVAAVLLGYSVTASGALPNPLTPGNPVVIDGENILEIDGTTGDLVQTIAPPGHVGALRDIVVNQEGKLVVLGEGPGPGVHVFDFTLPEGEREWQSMSADSWQFSDDQGAGELATLGPVVYVGDVTSADGTTGILGFDLERGNVEWVATGTAYTSLVVGPGLMLYGLHEDRPLVDVYTPGRPDADPSTSLFRQFQVSEVGQPEAIAVDYASTLHVAGVSGEVGRYARNGEHLGNSVLPVDAGVIDFALDETSRHAFVTAEGDVSLTRRGETVVSGHGDASGISFVPTYSPAQPVATFLGLVDEVNGMTAGPEAARLLVPEAEGMDVTLVDDRTIRVRFSGPEDHELAFTIPEPYPLDWGGTHLISDANHAGAAIDVKGEDCELEGRFEPHRIKLDDAGQPTELALNFEYGCKGQDSTRRGAIAWQTSRHQPDIDLAFLPVILGAGPAPTLAGASVSLSTPWIFPDDEIIDYQVTQLAGTPVSLDIEERQTFADTRYWPYLTLNFVAPLVTGESELLTFQIDLETEQGKRYNAIVSKEIRSRTEPRNRLIWTGMGLDSGLAFMQLSSTGVLHARPVDNGVDVTAVGTEIGQLGFAAPEGMKLSPGTYTNATPWPTGDLSGPSFWFADGRRDCSQAATSDFTVLRADYTEEQVNELAIDFDVHCDGGTITGELRYLDAGFSLTQADAGTDQSVTPGEEVVLDASESSDPLGEVTGYRWQQVSGPAVELAESDTASATFVAPEAGDETLSLVFQVSVQGDESLENVDRVTVQVTDDSGEETDDGDDRLRSWLERLRRLWAALGRG